MTALNVRFRISRHTLDALLFLLCSCVFTVRFVNVLMDDGTGRVLCAYAALTAITAAFSVAHWVLSVEE